MRKIGFWVIALAFPLVAWAEPGVYGLAQQKYDAGTMPTAVFEEDQLWQGQCVLQGSPNVRQPSAMLFHLETDPILGSVLFTLPRFSPTRGASEGDLTKECLKAFQGGGISSASSEPRVGALRTTWRDSRGINWTLDIRQSKSSSGRTVFLLKVQDFDRTTAHYCYYSNKSGEVREEDEDVPVPVPTPPGVK